MLSAIQITSSETATAEAEKCNFPCYLKNERKNESAPCQAIPMGRLIRTNGKLHMNIKKARAR